MEEEEDHPLLMRKEEQLQFIRDFIYMVQEDLLAGASWIPAHWDAHDLRQWVADTFQEQKFTLNRMKVRDRMRAYQNDIKASKGLL